MSQRIIILPTFGNTFLACFYGFSRKSIWAFDLDFFFTFFKKSDKNRGEKYVTSLGCDFTGDL